MASKVSAGSSGNDVTQSNVLTSGSNVQGTVVVGWNDADPSSVVMDNLERAKSQIQTYYAKKG